MNQLIHFLLSHLILDFEGEINLDTINRMLRDDNSPAARGLKSRLMQERDVEEFLVVLADCLRENIPTGITPDVLRSQLESYIEA